MLFNLIGEVNYNKLSNYMDNNFNKIIIRRVELTDKMINIHTD